MRCHLTLVKLSIIRKNTNNKLGWGCREKGTPYAIGGNVNWCSHCGKEYGGSLKNILKLEWPHDPAIPLLDIYLEKNESSNFKRYMHPDVHSSIIGDSPESSLKSLLIFTIQPHGWGNESSQISSRPGLLPNYDWDTCPLWECQPHHCQASPCSAQLQASVLGLRMLTTSPRPAVAQQKHQIPAYCLRSPG